MQLKEIHRYYKETKTNINTNLPQRDTKQLQSHKSTPKRHKTTTGRKK